MSCCQFTQALRTSRHHQIKFLLAAFLQSVPGTIIKIEDWEAIKNHQLEGETENPKAKPAALLVPDITVSIYDPLKCETQEEKELLGKRKNSSLIEFKIDVVVREVFAISHRKDNIEYGTANAAERDKKRKYAEYEKANKCVVIPFGLSSSGEFGKNAMKLIQMICKISKSKNKPILSSHFIERISLTLETMRFFMMNEYENHLCRLSSQLPSQRKGNWNLPLSPPDFLLPKQKKHFSHLQNSFWTSVHQSLPGLPRDQISSEKSISPKTPNSMPANPHHSVNPHHHIKVGEV
jgi:hypothetical protein